MTAKSMRNTFKPKRPATDHARTDVVRSYVLSPYTLAKDHRTGFEIADVTGVLSGERLDDMIRARLATKGTGQ